VEKAILASSHNIVTVEQEDDTKSYMGSSVNNLAEQSIEYEYQI
jgi:hypothetical protein